MITLQVNNEKFVVIYHYIIENKIPFKYKYNGCSQICGENPQITLYPRYDLNQFNIMFDSNLLFEELKKELKL